MSYQLLICLSGLIFGILFSCGIPDGHLLKYLLPLATAVVASLLWKSSRVIFDRLKVFTIILGFCSFFLAGWISIAVNRYQPGENINGKTKIIGRVVSYREVTDKMGQLVVSVRKQQKGSGWENRTGKIVLLLRPDRSMHYRPGDLWEFGSLAISAVSSKPSKNGFVPSRYWISRGVQYEARLVARESRLLRLARLPSVTGFFSDWQQTLSDRIDRIDLSEPSRALVKAMVLGDRSDVSAATMTDFSRAGIIHVISVSGLHVGIIYFIIAWLLKGAGFLGPRFRSVIALLVVWIYTGISGFSPSALRSAGMITLFEVSRIGRRGTPGLEVLAGTAIIHCLIDPYTIFSAGAQLSYLAVAGIFFWNPVFNPILVKMGRVGRYFGGTIAISLAAQSLITPLLLFWFGWVPLYFLIGNIALMPLLVFAFYLGLGITVLDFTGLSINLFNKVMDVLISLVMSGAAWLGNLPGNLVKPENLVWTDLVLYYFLLFLIRFYLDKPHPDIVRRMLAGTGLLFFLRYSGMLIFG
jgi:competence protein ComEC